MTHTLTPPPDPMTTAPLALPDHCPDLGPGWMYAGSVGIDSGTVLLVDPCYAKNAQPETSYLSADPYGEVPLSRAPLHTAVACQTGIGDGIYPAYVRLAESGRVAELRVVFLEGRRTDGRPHPGPRHGPPDGPGRRLPAAGGPGGRLPGAPLAATGQEINRPPGVRCW